jgi:hypothetical protein
LGGELAKPKELTLKESLDDGNIIGGDVSSIVPYKAFIVANFLLFYI